MATRHDDYADDLARRLLMLGQAADDAGHATPAMSAAFDASIRAQVSVDTEMRRLSAIRTILGDMGRCGGD